MTFSRINSAFDAISGAVPTASHYCGAMALSQSSTATTSAH